MTAHSHRGTVRPTATPRLRGSTLRSATYQNVSFQYVTF